MDERKVATQISSGVKLTNRQYGLLPPSTSKSNQNDDDDESWLAQLNHLLER